MFEEIFGSEPEIQALLAFFDWTGMNDDEQMKVAQELQVAIRDRRDSLATTTAVWDALPPEFTHRTDAGTWQRDFEDAYKRYSEIAYKTVLAETSGYVDKAISRLALPFGTDAWYNRDGASAALVRDPGKHGLDPIRILLGMDPTNPMLNRSFGVLKVGPENKDRLFIEPGITVVIAQSNKGKTTLLRNSISALLAKNLPRDEKRKVGFIPWNEREIYSYLGTEATLVGKIEDMLAAGATHVFIDSLRQWALGGNAPGSGGINQQFLFNLTAWHHAFSDRNAHAFLFFNPVTTKEEVLNNIKEIVRGSSAGLLIITEKGKAVYEHPASDREVEQISISKDAKLFRFVPGQSYDQDVEQIETQIAEEKIVLPPSVDVHEDPGLQARIYDKRPTVR